jgi:hypothetical protein
MSKIAVKKREVVYLITDPTLSIKVRPGPMCIDEQERPFTNIVLPKNAQVHITLYIVLERLHTVQRSPPNLPLLLPSSGPRKCQTLEFAPAISKSFVAAPDLSPTPAQNSGLCPKRLPRYCDQASCFAAPRRQSRVLAYLLRPSRLRANVRKRPIIRLSYKS